MASKRRGQGEGGVYQRCEKRAGCPPAEKFLDDRGKIKYDRPKHRCKGPWCASVDLGKKRDGSRDRRVIVRRSKSEVLDALDELKPKTKKAKGVAPSKIPKFAAYMDRWLSTVEVHRTTPKTLQSHRSQVDQHAAPHLGDIRLDLLEPSDILAWHTALRATPKARGDGTLAESTILRVHAIVSRALRDARPLGYLPDGNPMEGIDRPGAKGAAVAFLDAEQAAHLLRGVADDPLGSRWGFALMTGSRQGEALGLRWECIDLADGVADISWQLQRMPYRHGCGETCGRKYAGDCPAAELDVRQTYEHIHLEGALCLCRPKGDKSRIVPLVPSLLAWLRQRHLQAAPSPHDLVWTRHAGRPLDPRQDYQAWLDLLDARDLPRVRLHSARHSCVSLLLALNVAEPVIMSIVGHSTLAAARRYQHVDLAAARAALVQLGQQLHLPQLTELTPTETDTTP